MAKVKSTRVKSSGKCNLCGGAFGKASMTRHLAACLSSRSPQASSAKGTGRLLHLLVEGRGQPDYWMHLEMAAEDSLSTLDEFLRRTWLECCGHMSEFEIGESRYTSSGMGDFGSLGDESESMDVALGDVVQVGTKFSHQYDFGTTTELTLKVLGEREGAAKSALKLLAKNDPPVIECACGKPSTKVCTQCVWDQGGWLCDKCASSHECDEEMFLPVVNSPRVGMCGYTGA